ASTPGPTGAPRPTSTSSAGTSTWRSTACRSCATAATSWTRRRSPEAAAAPARRGPDIVDPRLRAIFNEHYTDTLPARMQALMDERLARPRFGFRLAETPLFLAPALRDRCAATAREILEQISKPEVIGACQAAIPERYRTPRPDPL